VKKKAEKAEGAKGTEDTTNMAQPEQAAADTMKTEYPDLVGTWTGTFQSHGATLKITGQDGEDFEGSLTVAYREPMIKSISGSIDPGTHKIAMKDKSKSRLETTYDVKISEDMSKIYGTAYYIVDKKTVNFTFIKK